MPNCSALGEADQLTLARVGEVVTNLTGFPVQCASLPATWCAASSEVQLGATVLAARQGLALPCRGAGPFTLASADLRDFVPWPPAAPAPRRVPDAAVMNDMLYCSGATSDCLMRGGAKIPYRLPTGVALGNDSAQ